MHGAFFDKPDGWKAANFRNGLLNTVDNFGSACTGSWHRRSAGSRGSPVDCSGSSSLLAGEACKMILDHFVHQSGLPPKIICL